MPISLARIEVSAPGAHEPRRICICIDGHTELTKLVGPLLVAFMGIVLALANSVPTFGRGYQTETPYTLYQIGVAIALAIGAIAFSCAAAFGFVLLSGAKPGWRAALRRSGAALTRVRTSSASFRYCWAGLDSGSSWSRGAR